MNMEVPENTQETMVNKIVGGSAEHQDSVRKMFEKEFKTQDIESFEREKTQEEINLIKDLVPFLNTFFESYGLEPISITPDHFHFIDKDKLDPTNPGNKILIDRMENRGAGGFVINKQRFVFFPDLGSKIKIAEVIVHEVIHAHSFISLTAGEDFTEGYNVRRIGTTITPREGHGESYFPQIEEAIVETLTIEFCKRYFRKIPSLVKDMENNDKVKQDFFSDEENQKGLEGYDLNEITYIERLQSRNAYSIDFSPYKPERLKLEKLIADIYEKHQDQFKNKKEVFKEFVQAHATGRLLRIAHLIDDTYGKGSFAELARDTTETE
jgi:hypothetical protein